MFENSDAVSFATNGTATYHYPNPDPSTIGPFGSGATLKTDGEKIVGRVEAPVVKITTFRKSGFLVRSGNSLDECLASVYSFYEDFDAKNMPVAWMHGSIYEIPEGSGRWEELMAAAISCGNLLGRVDRRLIATHGTSPAQLPKPASKTPTLDRLEAESMANASMQVRDSRQPTTRERGVMARINLAKSLAADWEAAKKQPALAHPYPFARNFQG